MEAMKTDNATDYILSTGFPLELLEKILKNTGLTVAEFSEGLRGLIDAGRTIDDIVAEYRAIYPDVSEIVKKSKGRGRSGAEYTGSLQIQYLWYPFLPLDEYSVIFGAAGTGKTFFLALIAACISAGKRLPCDDRDREPGIVLYVSSEESFEEVIDRIVKAGGRKENVIVIDRVDSLGLNLDEGFSELNSIVMSYHPDLVILDPWQAFLGGSVDMNRANMLRPILQKLALLAKSSHSAVCVVSHINKKDQGSDANFAACGSTELINASRSAIRLIEDENDDDRRIAVHTKSNHAKRGESVCFRFTPSGVRWDGVSDIDKGTLEEAARRRQSPAELKKSKENRDDGRRQLIAALMAEAKNTESCGLRMTYEDMKLKYGQNIFSGQQPKRLLDSLSEELSSREIFIKTGLDIRRGDKHYNGFFIQKIMDEADENF